MRGARHQQAMYLGPAVSPKALLPCTLPTGVPWGYLVRSELSHELVMQEEAEPI